MGELDEVAGAGLGAGADVEQERRRALRARHRELDRERRTADPLGAAHREQGGGHRRPGRAGADEGVGPVAGRGGGGHHHRGALARAHRGDGLVVVADLLGGGDQLDAIGAAQLGQLAPRRRRR